MEYQLIKIYIDQNEMRLKSCKDMSEGMFDFSKAQFYINNYLINPLNIPKYLILTVTSNEVVQVHESEDFYILQVFNHTSKGVLKCKYLNSQGNYELVNPNYLVWHTDNTKVTNEDIGKLIGEVIVVNKTESKFFLLTSKKELCEKPSISDLNWNKIGNGVIVEISNGSIWAKLNDDLTVNVPNPIFLRMNALKSVKNLVGKKVSVFQIKKKFYLKLKKERGNSSRSFSIQVFSGTFANYKEKEFFKNSGIAEFDFEENLSPNNSETQELLENETDIQRNSSIRVSANEKDQKFKSSNDYNSLLKHEKELEKKLSSQNLGRSLLIKENSSSAPIFKKLPKVQKNFRTQTHRIKITKTDSRANLCIQEFSNRLSYPNESKLNRSLTLQVFSNNYAFNKDPEADKSIQELRNNNIYESTIRTQRNLDLQEHSHEFISENEPKINYSLHNSNCKLQCLHLLDVFNKPGFSYQDFVLSEPIMNKNLGSVIGLGIIEHLIRFKKDLHFKNLIEKVFIRSSVISIFTENFGILNIKNVSSFNQNIKDHCLSIKRIGESVISLISQDIETFEGLQELSNTIGCCIHLKNFTEGFKEIKIVPIEYQIKRRPIINLGKYFNDYFLLYPKEILDVDGFNSSASKPTFNFPFYDEDLRGERKSLKSIFNSMLTKFQEIKVYLNKKFSGIKVDSINYSFEDVAKLYESYLYGKYNCKSVGNFKSKILNLDFGDVIYKVTGKKFFCNCGCNKYYDEANNLKKTCCCLRDYSEQHLLMLGRDALCWCQNMSVKAILTVSYNTVN